MLKNKRKPDKKKRIDVIKRFLLGEDIAEEILKESQEMITGFVFVNAVTGERMPEGFLSQMPSGYEPLPWHEEKTYPDPQFPDVRITNPENLIDNDSERIENEHQVPVSNLVTDRNQETSKEKSRRLIQEKLMQFAEQEKIDLQIRDKMNFWALMNCDL